MATTTSIKDSSILGTLTPNSISGAFSPSQNDTFGVDLYFSASAVGSVTLTRSTDNGASFAPFKAGDRVISARSSTGTLPVIEKTAGVLYRLEAGLSAGQVDFRVAKGAQIGPAGNDTGFFGVGATNPLPGYLTMTPAQIDRRFASLFTPVADADLVGNLTLYALWEGNTVVTLNVPAATARTRRNFLLGCCRSIGVDNATIASLKDPSGTALTSITHQVDKTSASCAVGDQVSGSGIFGHLTLLEAVTSGCYLQSPAPNLTALGL